jgi:3-oxoacyl-[acyl-carrier-protein] synthase II
MLVLESLKSARRRGALPLAEVAGYGLSSDAHHIVRPKPDGDGMVRAMRAALQDSGRSPDDVDYVCAHGTGTPANDRAEAAAVSALFGADLAKAPPMSSIKALTGHGLGAASALEAIACVLALQHETIPPTWNFRELDPNAAWDVVPNAPRPQSLRVVLNNAAAFGGNNSAVVFVRPSE